MHNGGCRTMCALGVWRPLSSDWNFRIPNILWCIWAARHSVVLINPRCTPSGSLISLCLFQLEFHPHFDTCDYSSPNWIIFFWFCELKRILPLFDRCNHSSNWQRIISLKFTWVDCKISLILSFSKKLCKLWRYGCNGIFTARAYKKRKILRSINDYQCNAASHVTMFPHAGR